MDLALVSARFFLLLCVLLPRQSLRMGCSLPLRLLGPKWAVSTCYLFCHPGWGRNACRAAGSPREINLVGCCSFVSGRWGTSLSVPIFTLILSIWTEGRDRTAIIPWVTHLTIACLMHTTDQELSLCYFSLHEHQEGLWASCRIPRSGLPECRYLGGLHTSSDFLTVSLEQDWQIIAWDCHTD